MTESRLFKILYLLLEQGRTTAPELASLFEVSIRTIYRDEFGRNPYLLQPRQGRGYFSDEGFCLRQGLIFRV